MAATEIDVELIPGEPLKVTLRSTEVSNHTSVRFTNKKKRKLLVVFDDKSSGPSSPFKTSSGGVISKARTDHDYECQVEGTFSFGCAVEEDGGFEDWPFGGGGDLKVGG